MPICDAFGKIEQDPNVYDVVHVKYYDEVCTHHSDSAASFIFLIFDSFGLHRILWSWMLLLAFRIMVFIFALIPRLRYFSTQCCASYLFLIYCLGNIILIYSSFFCYLKIHSSFSCCSSKFCLQRLRLIEIYDVKRLQMRYGNSTIGWVKSYEFGVVYCRNE